MIDILDTIAEISFTDLMQYQEAFASCAIEGNQTAEICLTALNKLLHGHKLGKLEREALGDMIQMLQEAEG